MIARRPAPRIVDRDGNGAPVFGSGELGGWSLRRDPYSTERTLRNAALAAFLAETAGESTKAYAIWTHQLDSGELVWQAFARALPVAVATLGGCAAGFSLSQGDVIESAERITRALGRKPDVAAEGDGPTPSGSEPWKGPRSILWTWPGSPSWLAVDVNTEGMCRQRTTRPVIAKPRPVLPCSDPHAEIPGQPDPHTMDECSAPTMSDTLGGELPPTEAELEAREEREAIQSVEAEAEANDPTTQARSKAFEVIKAAEGRLFALLASVQGGVRTQKECGTYRPCLACLGVVGPGHKWTSDTGRSRVHAACDAMLRNAFDSQDGPMISRLLGDLRRSDDGW